MEILMLKIYNSYYMYQLGHGKWKRFGYTGWFCKEESEVVRSKTVLENASFEQAFERFEKNPSHNIFSSRTFILRRPYLHLHRDVMELFSKPTDLFKKDFFSISIIEINEEKNGVTLEWIMEHLSADKAIQFLKERGMAVCPIKQ